LIVKGLFFYSVSIPPCVPFYWKWNTTKNNLVNDR